MTDKEYKAWHIYFLALREWYITPAILRDKSQEPVKPGPTEPSRDELLDYLRSELREIRRKRRQGPVRFNQAGQEESNYTNHLRHLLMEGVDRQRASEEERRITQQQRVAIFGQLESDLFQHCRSLALDDDQDMCTLMHIIDLSLRKSQGDGRQIEDFDIMPR